MTFTVSPPATTTRPITARQPRVAATTTDRLALGGVVMVLVVAWEIAARTVLADVYVLPAPSAIAQSLVVDASLYAQNTAATGANAAIGYAVGQSIAIAAAVILSLSLPVETVALKLALVIYCLPTLAIAPILGTIFGLEGTRVAVVAIVVFFPTMISTAAGLRSVSPETRAIVRVLGGGRIMLLRKAALRAALPQIFAGLKLGVPGAILGAIASEWLGATAGLGIFMVNSLAYLQPVRVWGSCVVCVAVTLAVYGLVALVDRRVNAWMREGRS